jgi:MarR family 2-MHQ and catechol resistance regulon transcriptional repressor
VSEDTFKRPDAMTLLLSIVRTKPQMDRFGQANLRHLGLGLTDFMILESLLHAGPITPSRLGDRVGLTRGSITSAVDRLAARGLVAREPNATDARSSLVKLTPIGATVIKAAWKAHAEAVERLLADAITAEESLVLLKLLGRVRRTVRRECRRVEAS